VQNLPVTCEALHFLAGRVGFVQFRAVGVLILTEAVAAQARPVFHLACRSYLVLVTGFFAVGVVRNEFRVVDCDQSAFDGFVRHLVTVLTLGLNHSAFGFNVPQEVARETNIVVDAEVLVPFEVAMACPARDSYSVHNFGQVTFMSKLDTVVVNFLGCDLFDTVTFRSQTGSVFDRGARLGADSAHGAVDRLGQPVDLAFDITGETRLQMAVQTVNVGMPRCFPTRIIGVHNVTGIAEAGLAGHNDRPGRNKAHENSQQKNPRRPFHLFDNVNY
jgi:hypothetical protein